MSVVKDLFGETIPMAMMIASPVAFVFGILLVINMRKEMVKNKSKSDVVIFTSIGLMMVLCICVSCFGIGYAGVCELKETKAFKAELFQKSKEYVVYVNGQEVSVDKINISKYNTDDIEINDTEKEIYIITTG